MISFSILLVTLLALALLMGFAKIQQDPYLTNHNPAWVGDYLNREHVLPGGARLNPAAFPRLSEVVVTTTAGDEAAGSSTVSVEALSGPIPAGAVLDFGGDAVELEAAAAEGDTSLDIVGTTDAIIAGGSTATYTGTGRVQVNAGTLVGRTFAERDASTAFGPADVATDDEVYITVHDVQDAATNADVALLRHGTLIKENFFPGWDSLSAAEKTWIRDNHETTIGQP